MSEGKLLIRADASPEIGSGHISRCLTLARTWGREVQTDVVFVVTECTDFLRRKIEDLGMELREETVTRGGVEDAEMCGDMAGDGFQWVILDGYEFDLSYQRHMRSTQASVLVIDDEGGTRGFQSDILLNPNAHAHRQGYVGVLNDDLVALLGTNYALIPQECIEAGEETIESAGSAKLVVSLGGGENAQGINRVFEILSRTKSKNMDVTVLAAETESKNLTSDDCDHSITLVEGSVSNPWRYFIDAGLAITTGGTTTLEALCLGIPNLTLSVSENQRPNAEVLDRLGVCVDLGRITDANLEQKAGHIDWLLLHPEKLKKMREDGRSLIDGGGSERVVRCMQDLHGDRGSRAEAG